MFDNPLYPMSTIRFAAQECERQKSGEMSVYRFMEAYHMALCESKHRDVPRLEHIIRLAGVIEPEHQMPRNCKIFVGWTQKIDHRQILKGLYQFEKRMPDLTPEQAYIAYENLHPATDGNGRLGTIIYNWLNKTLDDPIHPPDWDDPMAYWEGWNVRHWNEEENRESTVEDIFAHLPKDGVHSK